VRPHPVGEAGVVSVTELSPINNISLLMRDIDRIDARDPLVMYADPARRLAEKPRWAARKRSYRQ
jgi:hypothetical protein